MDWLLQNWIWIALAVGGYLLLMRMGVGGCGMGGCGMGRSAADSQRTDRGGGTGRDGSPRLR